MKILLLLPLLLGFSVPAIAHNEANGGDAMHNTIIHLGNGGNGGNGGCGNCAETEEGEGAEADVRFAPNGQEI